MKLFFRILFKDIYHLLRTAHARTFLRLAMRYGDAPRYQLREVEVAGFKLKVADCLSFLWQFKEIFADESYRFYSAHPQPVIYDCGANIGTSCLYFKRLYPNARIHAFEADPAIAQLLQTNLTENRLTNVTVIPKAVWIDANGVDLSAEGADGASVYGTGSKTRVPSVRLRDLLQAEPRVDMLKMDIEGAEVAVLDDCRHSLANVQHLFVEYHAYVHQAQSLDKLLTILTENNFRYYVQSARERRSPFLNHLYKNDSLMDLQLNIFAYK